MSSNRPSLRSTRWSIPFVLNPRAGITDTGVQDTSAWLQGGWSRGDVAMETLTLNQPHPTRTLHPTRDFPQGLLELR